MNEYSNGLSELDFYRSIQLHKKCPCKQCLKEIISLEAESEKRFGNKRKYEELGKKHEVD